MRFTVIDSNGAISFSGPGHGLKMIAAACSKGVLCHRELLSDLEPLDKALATTVRYGLARFDEHCIESDPATIERWFDQRDLRSGDAFRVLDDNTRRASLQPDQLGLVIFNLEQRRIVQVQNCYGSLLRIDRGRIRHDNRPIGRFYRYELPKEWVIVP